MSACKAVFWSWTQQIKGGNSSNEQTNVFRYARSKKQQVIRETLQGRWWYFGGFYCDKTTFFLNLQNWVKCLKKSCKCEHKKTISPNYSRHFPNPPFFLLRSRTWTPTQPIYYDNELRSCAPLWFFRYVQSSIICTRQSITPPKNLIHTKRLWCRMMMFWQFDWSSFCPPSSNKRLGLRGKDVLLYLD